MTIAISVKIEYSNFLGCMLITTTTKIQNVCVFTLYVTHTMSSVEIKLILTIYWNVVWYAHCTELTGKYA